MERPGLPGRDLNPTGGVRTVPCRALGALGALGAFWTCGASRTLRAGRSRGAAVAFGTLRASGTCVARSAGAALQTLLTRLTLGAGGPLRADLPRGAGGAGCGG